MYWDWALLPLSAAILFVFVFVLLLQLTMMMIRFLDVIFGLEHTLIARSMGSCRSWLV